MSESGENPASEDLGSLAEAIAAHLDLKREHGASEDEIERERQSLLGPARRDVDADADLHHHGAPGATDAESAGEPAEPAAQTAAQEAVDDTSAGAVDEAPIAAVGDAADDAEAVAPAADADARPPAPAPEVPGDSIEFDWDATRREHETAQEAAASASPVPAADDAPAVTPSGHDVLEDTPEFFEETPEYDKLWFEEKSPRDFNF